MSDGYNISIVIPAYNSEACIDRAIMSILNQTRHADEIIVVDDGSTDGTKTNVLEYGDRIRYIHQENGGVSCARNRGIRAAKGDWIGFLDADDEFLPERLFSQITILKQAPWLKWCAGNSILSVGHEERLRTPKKQLLCGLTEPGYFKNYFESATKKQGFICTPAVLIHRDVLKEVGGFEEGRSLAEDLDLWWRIAHRYPSIGYVANPITRIHLDVGQQAFGDRRRHGKTGRDIREVVSRHLSQSRTHGDHRVFSQYARVVLRDRLPEMIYNGFYDDALAMTEQFRAFFPFSIRVGCRALATFPRISTKAIRAGVAFCDRLGLSRGMSRRKLK